MARDIFKVGPVVSGESFLGRKNEVKNLSETIFEGVGAISLVGSTRIGKSSLVEKVFSENANATNRLCVKIVMGACEDAFAFWKSFAYHIKDRLLEKDLWDRYFENKFSIIDTLEPSNSHWYTVFQNNFGSVLGKIKEKNYRIVLAIDEFDGVTGVFQKSAYHYQFLRSIFSEPQYATSGVLISRRRLNLIDSSCDNISSFHGVFNEISLRPFSNLDMEEFYLALKNYCDVEFTPNGKKAFVNFTGKMPYLCSMLGKLMFQENKTSYAEGDVIKIFKQCQPQIDRHYDDLIKRLKEDNQLEFIYHLSLDNAISEIGEAEIKKFPENKRRKIENLLHMGILIFDEDDKRYYIFSKDFMTYFKYCQLDLPVWETMTLAEKKLKKIFGTVFPRLNETHYNKFIERKVQNDISKNYNELSFNWDEITSYAADLSLHKNNPSILDVLTLSFIIKAIIKLWDRQNFYKFFGREEWKKKLQLIKEIRNPIAHAHKEEVDPKLLETCLRYCEELCKLSI